MANVFKRAALTLGRWTGLGRQRQVEAERQDAAPVDDFKLIEPVADVMTEPGHPIDDLIDQAIADGTLERPEQILPPTDASATPWGDTLAGDAATVATTDGVTEATATSETVTETVTAIETAVASAETETETETAVSTETAVVFATAAIEPEASETPAATTVTPVTPVTFTATDDDGARHAEIAELTPAAAAADLAPVAEMAAAVADSETVPAPAPEAEVAPIVELKPQRPARSGPTFTQLYKLISTETNRRTDATFAVYERLMAATREDLESSRRANKIAWSIGGVMTAVAAMGAVWSAGEVAGTRVEVSTLKQQVSAAAQVAAERDQLRGELMKVTQVSARAEADALRSRLDQALAVSAERDRLRTELAATRREKQEIEGELRLARVATTQPLSDARPANDRTAGHAPRAAGSERADVWSVLLNGND
jgi:hypothetical protein